jgi:hypothetical protein
MAKSISTAKPAIKSTGTTLRNSTDSVPPSKASQTALRIPIWSWPTGLVS